MWNPNIVLAGVVIFAAYLQLIKTEDPDEADPDKINASKLWQPKGVSREEWVRCRGMPCSRWEVRQLKLMELRRLSKKNNGDDVENRDTDEGRPELMSRLAIQNIQQEDDMMLTDSEIDEALQLQQLRSRGTKPPKNLRSRRKIEANVEKVNWDFPIFWKMDGTHTNTEKIMIRNSIKHWQDNTCVRFKWIPIHFNVTQSHVLFTRYYRGCFALIGKSPTYPQPVNLAGSCFQSGIGIPVHEIGHTLGFHHEHQRSDRDAYVNIIHQNMGPYEAQFQKRNTRSDVPYDFGSIMMYNKMSFTKNFKPTILPKDKYKYYINSMGQRMGLSFLDAKMFNMLPQCKKICTNTPLNEKCQRGGYQDPNDCTKCRCPPGFAGKFCELIAPAKNANCGGSYQLTDKMYISSPEYPFIYKNFAECNWYLKVPQGHKIKFTFYNSAFSMHDGRHTCNHWVEIVGTGNLDYPGPKICGWRKPDNFEYISENNEMLVMFRSNFAVSVKYMRKGFNALVQPVPKLYGGKVQTLSIPSVFNSNTSPPTTTVQTTTTRQPTTTTTQWSFTLTQQPTTAGAETNQPAETTTQNSNEPYSFYCGFEEGDHKPETCGMIQNQDDVFDWMPKTGSTPSRFTGPSFAKFGSWYIFLETSRRKLEDNALIELPPVSRNGNYCLKFWYNMNGVSIYKLKVHKAKDGDMHLLWKIRGHQGGHNADKKWFAKEVTVFLAANERIVFEGIRGFDYTGDIALDEISLKAC